MILSITYVDHILNPVLDINRRISYLHTYNNIPHQEKMKIPVSNLNYYVADFNAMC